MLLFPIKMVTITKPFCIMEIAGYRPFCPCDEELE
jgi:hypothetical protein